MEREKRTLKKAHGSLSEVKRVSKVKNKNQRPSISNEMEDETSLFSTPKGFYFDNKKEITVGVIAFSFEVIPIKLHEKYLRFYQSVIESLTKKNVLIILLKADKEYRATKLLNTSQIIGDLWTIPLSFEESQLNPQKAGTLLEERIHSWGVKYDIVLVDLTSQRINQAVRPSITASITAKIQELLSEQEDTKSVFLIQTLLENDATIKDAFDENKDILFIEDTGEIKGYLGIRDNFNSEKYQTKLANLSDNPLRWLKLKMIRRIGHFKTDSKCTEFMYDGSLCSNELTNILSRCFLYDENGIKRRHPLFVIYNCPHDHWLESPVILADAPPGSKRLSYEEFRENLEINKSEIESMEYEALILLPMIDTGSTLDKIIKDLGKEFFSKINHKIFAIICSSEDVNNSEFNLAQISDKNDSIILLEKMIGGRHVYHLMECEQKRYKEDLNPCPRCEMNLPANDFYEDDYLMLNTFEIWKMIKETGWLPEIDPLPHRKSLKFIPNYKQIVENYKDWIAYKLLQMIKYYVPQPDTVIIYPEGDSIGLLIEYLEMVGKISSVCIPRQAINSISQNSSNIKLIEEKWSNEDWYHELQNTSQNKTDFRIIILDTMIISGETVRGIKKFLAYFNCEDKIYSYFFIVDSRSDKENFLKNEKVLSLYRLPLHTL